MIKFLDRDSNTVTVSVFYENYLLGKYNMDPPYQRLSVWSDEKQSFLIDSILKNFPIPPIFLRQHIEESTGKTFYDVIDGKQRLRSLIRFIDGEIPVSMEQEDEFSDEALAGKYFDELETGSLADYKRSFWRYVIPVEYVDTTSKSLVDKIFDRLNRNGEPLRGQELRNAQHNQSSLMKVVRRLKEIPFWMERLEVVDRSRMEDDEFISELLFLLLEDAIITADQNILDDLYSRYIDADDLLARAEEDFLRITEIMETFQLDYEEYRVRGVSHLYSLWSFAWYLFRSETAADSVKEKLHAFLQQLRSRDIVDADVRSYKLAMSSRTKSKAQRQVRLNSLIAFCLK